MPDRESKSEQLDRELGELLQGLRVLLPGVQVLFAFLLTVPFAARFTRITANDKAVYLAALLCAALASALLIAPSAFHRIVFRAHDKEWLLLASYTVAIIGTIFLATAISLSVFLVTDVIYGSRLAAVVTTGFALLFVALWYVVPLVHRMRHR